jgi:hypothetical protein
MRRVGDQRKKVEDGNAGAEQGANLALPTRLQKVVTHPGGNRRLRLNVSFR